MKNIAKKLAILSIVGIMQVGFGTSIIEAHNYDNDNRDNHHHYHHHHWQDDRRAHHEQMWRDHEDHWRDHDREWQEHSGDWGWREEHRRMWSEWYEWHRANENEFHFHVSTDGFVLDING